MALVTSLALNNVLSHAPWGPSMNALSVLSSSRNDRFGDKTDPFGEFFGERHTTSDELLLFPTWKQTNN